MRIRIIILKVASIFLVIMFMQANVFSQKLLKDINTKNNGSNLNDYTQVGDISFFIADDGIHGRELWKTDGTDAGTMFVKDIYAGKTSSESNSLTAYNGLLFFVAKDGIHGKELWKSDGTEAGTVMVKDIITADINDSEIHYLTLFNGILYFTAYDDTHKTELWKSDGTEAGTVMLKDINQGSSMGGNSYLRSFFAFNNELYFSAYEDATDRELWKTDGTVAGTVIVKDINPSGASNPKEFAILNNELYFVADDGTTGDELWKTDGTEAGTVQVKDINSTDDSNPEDLTVFNNKLYFRADNGTTGYELWKTDGTEDGTIQVKDICAGTNDSEPDNFTEYNGILYFSAYDDTYGKELWRTDGTVDGTILVKDINTGTDDSSPHSFTIFNGTLVFATGSSGHGKGGGSAPANLWKTDGTEAGTIQLHDNDEKPIPELCIFENNLYFKGYDTNTTMSGLWKTDGTVAGTSLIKNIKTIDDGEGEYVGNFHIVNEIFVFSAEDDGQFGREMWKTDGTIAGTVLLRDINNSTQFSEPRYFTHINGTTFFSAYDGTAGSRLWKTDGTEAGTVRINPTETFGNIGHNTLTNANGTLFFTAYASPGYNLWKSDGTDAGTVKVSTNTFGSIYVLTPIDDKVYFAADNGTGGKELWISDGTEAGTIMIDINSTGDSDPGQFVKFGTDVFFQANDGTNGVELWKTDGTEGGTVMVKDIRTGANASNPSNFIDYNGTLIFRANDGTNGYELWKTDGTEAGTVMLKDINGGSANSSPNNFIISNSDLFFIANNGLYKTDGTEAGTEAVYTGFIYMYKMIHFNGNFYFYAEKGTYGKEPWISDGTSAGTTILKDVNSGAEGSNSGSFVNEFYFTGIGANVYFVADDGVHGAEIWETDGTEAGTTILKDILEGDKGSYIQYLENTGTQLIFGAENANFGRELWEYTPTLEYANITSHPTDAIICEGENTSFSITADNATSYQWQVNNGTGFTDISGGIYSGETTNTLTLNTVTEDYNAYKYKCLAQNTGGNTESLIVTLFVYSAPTTANAGIDAENLCGLQYVLSANEPINGEIGTWTILSGGIGTFDNENLNTATFTADADGTYILTWTIDNGNCQTSSEVEINLAVDTENPILILQNYTTELDATGNATITMQDVITSATDNCEISDTTITQTNFDCSDVGTPVMIDVVLTDVSGNSYTETTIITVQDNIDPIIAVKNLTVQLNAIGNATITMQDVITSATDNCEISDTTITQTNFDCSNVETPVNIDVTLTDISGNEMTETVIITVEDNIMPTMTCISNTTVTANQFHVYVVNGTEFDPTDILDNCGVASTLNDYNNSETLASVQLDEGMHTINWTITDDNGNFKTCLYTITVNAYVGINDILNNDISIYPNPTNGILHINNTEGLNISKLELVDIAGKVIYNSQLINEKSEIDMSNQSNGIYFVRIQTDNQVYIQKIIKN